MYSREEVAGTIDHAVLKPFATDKDIIDGCRMCDERGVTSICVRPSDVALAARDVPRLDVARSAGLVLPVLVLLVHQAQLAVGLAVAGRVGLFARPLPISTPTACRSYGRRRP